MSEDCNTEVLFKIKLDYGFWFVDWINQSDDGCHAWANEYTNHPLYWDVVEEFGREPDFLELIEAYGMDDFSNRHPFRFIIFWFSVVSRISDIFYWMHLKCDRLAAWVFKCNVYHLPWYNQYIH